MASSHDALSCWSSGPAKIYYTPQNISEFWNVATRPAQLNGFGLLPKEADAIVLLIEEKFHLAADSRHETYKLWRSLILDHQVSGVRVHDVKLIASALAHRIPAIITSNGKDFKKVPSSHDLLSDGFSRTPDKLAECAISSQTPVSLS